jgi:hypothetical protein
VTDPVPDRPASLAVLGLLANCELAAFSRLAADAERAPQVTDRIELCRLGGAALSRLEKVAARIGELDASLEETVLPFVGTFAEFDERTPAGTWWERLLKAHVGYGVEEDLVRLLARPVDAGTRELILALLDDDRHATLVVQRITAATAADAVLASRLALWGRRLGGEALGVVQRVLSAHPRLRALLEPALPDAVEADLQQRLFAVLTAEHTRRMGRLGLTA